MRRGEGSAQDRFPRTANDRRYRLYLLLHIHSEEPEKRAAKAPWSAARRNNPSGTVFLTGPRKGPGCLRAPSVDCPRFAQTPYMTGGVVPEISWEDFEKVDVRVGKVLEARPFPEARKPAVKLSVDFGPEVGINTNPAH